MVIMHIAYGLDLIALTMGTGLLVWSMKNPGKGSWLGKLFGAIVMILSIIAILCIYSCALKGGECHRSSMGMGEENMSAMSAGEMAHEHTAPAPAKKMEHH